MAKLVHPALHDLQCRLQRDETLTPGAYRRFLLALQEADAALQAQAARAATETTPGRRKTA